MRRFILDLVLPSVGLLSAGAVFREHRHARMILWAWLPMAVIFFLVAALGNALFTLELLLSLLLGYSYLVAWAAVAAWSAWRASGGMVARILGLLLALTMPGSIFFVAEHLSILVSLRATIWIDWFSLLWLFVVLPLAVAWKRAAQRTRAEQGEKPRPGTESDDARVSWRVPAWVVGAALLLPASVAWLMRLWREPFAGLGDAPVFFHIGYAWFAAACLYGFIGLVMWPSRRPRLQNPGA